MQSPDEFEKDTHPGTDWDTVAEQQAEDLAERRAELGGEPLVPAAMQVLCPCGTPVPHCHCAVSRSPHRHEGGEVITDFVPSCEGDSAVAGMAHLAGQPDGNDSPSVHHVHDSDSAGAQQHT